MSKEKDKEIYEFLKKMFKKKRPKEGTYEIDKDKKGEFKMKEKKDTIN